LDVESYIEVAAVLAAFALIAVASMADTAIGSIHKHRARRLVEDDVPGSHILQTLVDQPELFRSSTVVASILGAIAATASAVPLAQKSGTGIPALFPILALAVGILVLGEMTPRIYSARHPEKTALALAPVVISLHGVLLPFTSLAAWLARLAFLPFGRRMQPKDIFALDEESLYLGNGAVEEPEQHEEQELIESVFRFAGTSVREVMIPRIYVVGLEKTATVLESIDVALKGGYSRLPVYDDNLDNVTGVLYLKDLWKHVRSGATDAGIARLARPAYFVPDTKRVDELLRELQQKRVHMAVVVDEYGGTAGIVTIEDLLEEIVGEINDEYDVDKPLFEQISDTEVVFDARASLDDVDNALSVDWKSDESDTLGGLMHERLGKIPAVGDGVSIGDYHLSVIEAEGRKLRRIKVVHCQTVEDCLLVPGAGHDQSSDQAMQN
jgi:putative hemolysin